MAVADQRIAQTYAIYQGDCVEGMKQLPDGRIHLSVYSPPFGGLYHYSSDENARRGNGSRTTSAVGRAA